MLWINAFRKPWSDRMSDVKDNTARRKYMMKTLTRNL